MSTRTINNLASKLVLFDAERVGEILQLCTRLLRVPHDPVASKQQLIEGMARLVGADYGLCAIASHGDFSDPVRMVSIMSLTGWRSKTRLLYRQPTTSIVNRLLATLPGGYSDQAPLRKSAALDPHQINSMLPLDEDGSQAAVVLTRRPNRSGFSANDRTLIDLFHTHMQWIYKIDLPLTSQEVASLSCRPRQTLQYLLAGFSEKETAAALSLSTNTVHHYVKHLYRHFKVCSRSELLSRWVKD